MKRWHVVQVFAGYEDRVKADIEKHARESGLEEKIGQVLVPSAKLKQFIAVDEQEGHQLFPGYVLVEMEYSPEVLRVVTASPRVIKVLGVLSKREIDRIFSQVSGEIQIASTKSDFVVGSEVEIKEGPFAGFFGIIDKVDDESEMLTVMVSIFGRMTPVELSFRQVNR